MRRDRVEETFLWQSIAHGLIVEQCTELTPKHPGTRPGALMREVSGLDATYIRVWYD